MIGDRFTEASYANATQGVASYSETFMYFNNPEDGARVTKGWFKVVPGYYLQEDKYNDGEDYWYYADGDGEIYANVIKTIKGKKYAFDNYGRMIDGLALLQMATDGDKIESAKIDKKWADDAAGYEYDTEDNFDATVVAHADELTTGALRFYYFGDSDDGAMKTGKQNVEIDGENFTFKFKESSSSKGAGIHGEDDDKLYNGGKLIKANSDDKYKVVEYVTEKDGNGKVSKITMRTMDADEFIDLCGDPTTDDDDETVWTAPKYDKTSLTKYYLVNTSGSIVKSKSAAKDGEDYKFEVKDQIIKSVTLEN